MEQFYEGGYIPDSVFDTLPEVLKQGSSKFTNLRERDVFLISSLGVLSGCFPNLKGVYDGDETGSNLFALIIAPPASGKGVMKWSRYYGGSIHELIKKTHKDQGGVPMTVTGGDEEGDKELGFPSTLFIPGNSSSAAIYSSLKENMGRGIIFETEADTLNNVLAREWGDFSDVLRKAFHGEALSISRKTDKLLFELKNPAISVVLSGTFDQLKRLIKDYENGLFSRFIFYKYDDVSPFRNVFGKKSGHRMDFILLGGKILDLYRRGHRQVKVILSDDQRSRFNENFSQWDQETISSYGGVGSSIIKRLGLISFRIMMILSYLRYTERDFPDEITCMDEDFKTAIDLACVFKAHSTSLINSMLLLPKSADKWHETLIRYFNALPEEFARKHADELADKLGVKKSTAEKFLEKYVHEGALTRIKQGEYKKSK
jgi:hypothetical protein